MKMNVMTMCAVCSALVSGVSFADTFGTGDNQFDIDFVSISGATNPTSGYGIVNNDYRMGTYEVTNDQWNKFKAAYGTVTGDPSSAYDSDPDWTGSSVPTNRVSWYESAQFVNWLNTSTGYQAAYKFTGTQGQSDYAFDTWSAAEAAGGTNLYRHKDAHYFLPTDDEWVKAAYWNGTDLQTYATTDGSKPETGVDSNYNQEQPHDGPWDVGGGSEELNGTYDMMGNIWECMESPCSGEYLSGSNRGIRGGAYSSNFITIGSSYRNDLNSPYYEGNNLGFRVASEVPEPATICLLGLGGFFIRRKRRA